MIEVFKSYFQGYFDNQRQAFQYPREYALICLNHIKLNEEEFKVTQQYSYEKTPYRETIVKLSEENDLIISKNYKCNNGELTYLSGCDTIFKWDGDVFRGRSACNECFVNRGGKETYLITESVLGNGYYRVIDQGFDINTHEQVWGSVNGFFEFDRK